MSGVSGGQVTKGASEGRSRRFRGQYKIESGKPIEIIVEEDNPIRVSDDDENQAALISGTLKAYRAALKDLLATKYADLRDVAPSHLRLECDLFVILCDDGIILRHDRPTGDPARIRIGRVADPPETTITALAPKFSEGFVYCPTEVSGFELPSTGPKVQLFQSNPATGERAEVFGGFVGMVVPWGEVRSQASSGGRPIPLVSVSNEFEIQMLGEMFDAGAPPDPGRGRGFVVRSQMKLPVGWEAFEIYPPFDPSAWQPSIGATWAELDLLAAATRRNLQEDRFRAVDPRAQLRRQFLGLFREFSNLLNGAEAPLQEFLEAHAEILSPTHTAMWRKLPLGAHVTDFVFREPGSEYLLVEIEAPGRKLFRADGQQHGDLTHAINQVLDWTRYIEDNLRTVQQELGLESISASARSLVVIGRSSTLTEDDKRKLITLTNRTPGTRILTYDDLLVSAKANIEHLLGPLWETPANTEVYYLPGPPSGEPSGHRP